MTSISGHINKPATFRIHIRGRVQGVGFRPFIYRRAIQTGVAGEVFNRTDGVIIHIEGDGVSCKKFIDDLQDQSPFASVIKKIEIEPAVFKGCQGFRIIASRESEDVITEISPDIAVCQDCLQEIHSGGRRQNYPFINCTNCGPRFTIMDNLPYDRVHTTMGEFEMCPECGREYHDPDTRFFHAQPVSCFACGPVYRMYREGKYTEDFSLILNSVCSQIDGGCVVAIKSLGGYNLACDAYNDDAVKELRQFKKRDRKPFAVLFSSIDAVRRIVPVSPEEEAALLSWRRPIVILSGATGTKLAAGITSGLTTLGAFLPYLPLQYLIFDRIKTDAVVMTSGNESDSPILFDDDAALHTFRTISGGIVTNNRKIARRADDSVVRVICKEPRLMRRSRGYTPQPVDLGFNAHGILATGAELSNAFCIGKNNQAIFSQHIGDLKNSETYDFFTENIQKFSDIYRFRAERVACDMHHDYLSTGFARESGLPVTEVQHHHAHIASVMAEHGLSESVIGLAYDGTGLGTDGHIWGSEALVVDYTHFKRISHFEYLPLPGGDAVSREPWRTGLSYLYRAYGPEWQKQDVPLLKKIDPDRAEKLIGAIDKNINSPLSCGAGRLFDAIAAIMGICTETNYHAEAPLLLENYLIPKVLGRYSFKGTDEISFIPAILEIADDLAKNISPV